MIYVKAIVQIEKREDLHITRSPDFYGLLYFVSYLYTFALLFPNFAYLLFSLSLICTGIYIVFPKPNVFLLSVCIVKIHIYVYVSYSRS